MARTKLFIGHANPQDNEFTLWVCAKLRNEGYDAICDLNLLIGGEQDYWKTLQDVLENESCKYLLVFTKDTFTKQGVIDEWEQVRAIQRKHSLKDFIYILKKDDVSFNERIGINVYNHFRFDISWSNGLKQLTKKLYFDNVPKTLTKSLSLNNWLKNPYTNNSGVIPKKEIFYSNCLKIEGYPNEIYIFEYHNSAQAEAILEEINLYPAIQHDKYIVTFKEDIPKYLKKFNYDVLPRKKFIINVTDLNFSNYNEVFPKSGDLKRFTVQLFNDAFHKFLNNRGISFYMMSQNKKCYYYVKDQIPDDKVHFIYNEKKTWKLLIGHDKSHFWHFGISFSSSLFPEHSYFIKTHLLFSDDRLKIWENSNRLHGARRAKGKSFFNKAWRSLLFAFLKTLSADGNNIIIPLTENSSLTLSTTPISYISNFGYQEPLSEGRLVPIDYYERDSEDENEDEFETQNEFVDDDKPFK